MYLCKRLGRFLSNNGGFVEVLNMYVGKYSAHPEFSEACSGSCIRNKWVQGENIVKLLRCSEVGYDA